MPRGKPRKLSVLVSSRGTCYQFFRDCGRATLPIWRTGFSKMQARAAYSKGPPTSCQRCHSSSEARCALPSSVRRALPEHPHHLSLSAGTGDPMAQGWLPRLRQGRVTATRRCVTGTGSAHTESAGAGRPPAGERVGGGFVHGVSRVEI